MEMRNVMGHVEPAPRARAITRRPRKIEKLIDRFRFRGWFSGKDLTSDWTSANFTMWRRVLSPLQDRPLRILEIGSWEGRSTIFFLRFFPEATITCVDTFAGNEGEPQYAPLLAAVGGPEARFDGNVAEFGARVAKRRGNSADVLAALIEEGCRFDLAYIDGDHRRDPVLIDSRLVWQMIAPGGVVIWDDYEFGADLPDSERPKPAIDRFLGEQAGNYRVLARTYQLAVERTR